MKSQTERLKRIIESDRMSFTAEGTELIIKDIGYVLNDYFSLRDKPRMNIIPITGGYKVVIEVLADAVRTFGVMP